MDLFKTYLIPLSLLLFLTGCTPYRVSRENSEIPL